MITFRHKGNFEKTSRFFTKAGKPKMSLFDKIGAKGVEALSAATPKDTGKTAESWYYRVTQTSRGYEIQFLNSNVNITSTGKRASVAIVLQYGHATRNGGWVEGIDYINPALKPVFEKLTKEAWEEVKRQ